MRPILIAIASLIGLSACDSDQERMIKSIEKQIRTTIQHDWNVSIPLDDLLDSRKNCQRFPDLEDCEIVEQQLQDIATSVASCRANQRSMLCQAVLRDISKYPSPPQLPEADAQQLPDSPWYLRLPTTALEAQAGKFNYREEITSWWWQAWGAYILSCAALTALYYVAWHWWNGRREDERKHAAALSCQRAARAEHERTSRIREEQAQAEAKYQAMLAQEAAIAEQAHLAAEKLAEQQAADIAVRLAAEQSEAAALLDAAFKAPAKPKRRKNAPSSK